MAGRVQIAIAVAVAAVAAGGAVVVITLETRDTPPKLQPQAGKPPAPPANLPGPFAPAIRQAFRDWPHGSIDLLERLSQEYPRSPVVQLYLGIGLAWAGYYGEANIALEQAKKHGRDTPTEVTADTWLHPSFVPNDPPFELTATAGPLLR